MIDGRWPDGPFACDAVVRYRGTPSPAIATVEPNGEAAIRFTGEPPIASPGQAVVFYRGDEILGGGTIRRVIRSVEARGEPAPASIVR